MASIGVERERSNESIIACRLLSYELLLPLRSCPPSVFSGMETNASASLPSMPEKTKEPSSCRSDFPSGGYYLFHHFPYMAFRESCGQHKISAFTLPVHDTVACGACQGESPATVGGEKLARPGHEETAVAEFLLLLYQFAFCHTVLLSSLISLQISSFLHSICLYRFFNTTFSKCPAK